MRLSPLEGHRLWSKTYDSEPNPMLSLESRTVLESLGDLQGKAFLDAGCGTGRWLVAARERGASVFGVDFCREMLAQAAAKTGLYGVSALGDLRRLPLGDACADLVMCAFSLGYVDEVEIVVQEFARCLRHGGSLWLTDLHPRAHEAGWRRSFRSGHRVVEIEHHPCSIERLITAGQVAGMKIENLLEPHFDEPEREIFRRAGKLAYFGEARAIPAVLIVQWKRP